MMNWLNLYAGADALMIVALMKKPVRVASKKYLESEEKEDDQK